MILDTLKNADKYYKLNGDLKKAFEFLRANKLEELESGRYEIEKDDVYAMVQAYTTSSDNEVKWEAHKKFIDIQYVIEGTEVIGWMPTDKLTVKEEYAAEKDITFYNEVERWTKCALNAGEFAIFFPEDGHKPCCSFEKPLPVKKVVVKVRI